MKKDESFTKFLDIKRGAAMHTLESLMLLPVREGERERERASSYTLFINHMYCSYRISNIIKYLFSKQVQRVSDYKRYLTQLLSLTHRNHPDYQNIKVTVGRTEEVLQYLIMVTCGVHCYYLSLLLFLLLDYSSKSWWVTLSSKRLKARAGPGSLSKWPAVPVWKTWHHGCKETERGREREREMSLWILLVLHVQDGRDWQ